MGRLGPQTAPVGVENAAAAVPQQATVSTAPGNSTRNCKAKNNENVSTRHGAHDVHGSVIGNRKWTRPKHPSTRERSGTWRATQRAVTGPRGGMASWGLAGPRQRVLRADAHQAAWLLFCAVSRTTPSRHRGDQRWPGVMAGHAGYLPSR